MAGFTCRINSTIILLICHWATPVRPSKLSVATWVSSQLDKRLHHAGKQPHPRRVNMGIAKSHKEVTQVGVPNSHSCQDTPPHPSVSLSIRRED
jgi:hypothetical protein